MSSRVEGSKYTIEPGNSALLVPRTRNIASEMKPVSDPPSVLEFLTYLTWTVCSPSVISNVWVVMLPCLEAMYTLSIHSSMRSEDSDDVPHLILKSADVPDGTLTVLSMLAVESAMNWFVLPSMCTPLRIAVSNG